MASTAKSSAPYAAGAHRRRRLCAGSDRSGFSNAGNVVALHPDFLSLQWEARGCAEPVVTGPILEEIRAT